MPSRRRRIAPPLTSASASGPSRRRFLGGAAAAGVGFWVGGRAYGADGAAAAPSVTDALPPSERLSVGVIGVGHRGKANLDELANVREVDVVALCDVDDTFMAPAAKKFEKAATYKDFRLMLDKEKLDAVLVATPDHTHFHASLLAIRSGRHVYCEKPLTHTVWEARTLTDAAVKAKRVTQLGTQIHAGDNYRRVVELIRGGAIGAVKEVHVFMGGRWAAPGGRPKESKPVPSTLDYDLWLGPAEEYAYHPTYVPENWRSYWNFGNGTLGDMACHHVDLPFWALGLRYPTQVTPVEGPKPHADGAPEWLTVRWDFAADGPRGPVSVTWHQGGGDEHLPDEWDDWQLPEKWRTGNVFVGEKGILFADYGGHGLRPESDYKDFQRPEPSIAKSVGHHREWAVACKAGDVTAPLCNFTYGGPLTETVLLGCVAYRAQTPLQWDAANLKVTNTREADRYLRRAYRKGWEVNV